MSINWRTKTFWHNGRLYIHKLSKNMLINRTYKYKISSEFSFVSMKKRGQAISIFHTISFFVANTSAAVV